MTATLDLTRSNGTIPPTISPGYSAMYAYAIIAVFSLCFLGCGASKPVRLAARMSVPDYAALANRIETARESPEPSGTTAVIYPILEIFAPDGRLVFQGDSISQNLALLRQREIDFSKFPPVASHVQLQDIVSQVGEFRRYSRQLNSSKQYTFLSISLSNCGSCRTQEDLLEQSNNGTVLARTNRLFLVLDP